MDTCPRCEKPLDRCRCPICPSCGLQGEAACYQEYDLGGCNGLYGAEWFCPNPKCNWVGRDEDRGSRCIQKQTWQDPEVWEHCCPECGGELEEI